VPEKKGARSAAARISFFERVGGVERRSGNVEQGDCLAHH
jgi:hypothetical protein